MNQDRRGAVAQATQHPPDAPATLQARLETWRADGAWRLDPTRFHYLEALSRRLAGQSETVRSLLEDRLHAALADYADRLAQARQAGGDPLTGNRHAVQAAAGAACLPLSQLNQSIRDARQAGQSVGATQPGELASVHRFRQAWSRGRAQEQVERAATRRPANAGPLNSHMLVLQSLDLMRELSPDYLRRFLAQVESLQWLERAREVHAPPRARPGAPTKPARRGRTKE